MDTTVVEIAVSLVIPWPGQPRKVFPLAELQALAESLARQGQLVPILLRPRKLPEGGDGYQLIDGERRWRAAKMAGLTVLRCVVVEATDEQAYEMAREANDRESPPTFLDRIFYVDHYLPRNERGTSNRGAVEKLAADLRVDRRTVEIAVTLLNIIHPETWQAAIEIMAQGPKSMAANAGRPPSDGGSGTPHDHVEFADSEGSASVWKLTRDMLIDVKELEHPLQKQALLMVADKRLKGGQVKSLVRWASSNKNVDGWVSGWDKTQKAAGLDWRGAASAKAPPSGVTGHIGKELRESEDRFETPERMARIALAVWDWATSEGFYLPDAAKRHDIDEEIIHVYAGILFASLARMVQTGELRINVIDNPPPGWGREFLHLAKMLTGEATGPKPRS